MCRDNRRKAGLDLLKIVSMCMIIGLHFFLNEICYDEDISGVNYCLAWALEAFAYQAVDIFIIVTGYLSVGKSINIKRIKNIWKKMLFYSILFLVGFFLYKEKNSISISDVLYSLFPFLSGHYWFVTTYIILQIMRPLIDRFRDSATKKEYYRLLLSLIVLFSVVRTVFPFSDSRFVQSSGASIIWFITLYLCGGYLNAYQVHIRTNVLAAVELICIAAPLTTKFVYILLTGTNNGSSVFYHHNSIFIFCGAIATFLLFEDIDLKNSILKNFVAWCIPSNLAVYFIHENVFVKKYLWEFVEQIKSYNIVSIVTLELITIMVVYLLCILLDKTLLHLFGILKKIVNICRFDTSIRRF